VPLDVFVANYLRDMAFIDKLVNGETE
jgi:hypothetical protein